MTDLEQAEWYEREKAAFIAWWESEGQSKFSENPTLAAGAGWLARAESGTTCVRCNGAGSVMALTQHLGPDDYEVEVECPECKGTGAK